MNSSFFSKNLIKLNEIDSTNKFLLDLNEKRQFTNSVVVTADYQTKGKGRRANSWESENGKNLLLSILFKHNLKIKNQFLFSAAISLSIQMLISQFTNERVYIKWPNDIMINNKKIAGFIIDNLFQKNTIHTTVVGIGVNVNQLKFKKYNPEAISISLINNSVIDLDHLKYELLNIIDENYNNMDDGFIKKYNKLLFMKNSYINFKIKEKIIKAKIHSVDKTGAILLEKKNKGIERFEVNQVCYLL